MFFDEADDKVFMDEEELVVIRQPRATSQCEDDALKQIFEKEFVPRNEETVKLIQKPPRKSLERRSYSSHNAMQFNN